MPFFLYLCLDTYGDTYMGLLDRKSAKDHDCEG